ncbi:hypothetical protein AMAG_18621 [Allomyces macrogynus ATCC 38327]|uniref:Uncharacterized protein n=1 Tax=Allomyces macrogynus (strain ATCC 38327) TaxID=578462 RepID=A0A0L0SFZ7_ALLM3|nr:hypothetical protein AMAG_18621 [Allomyces macrogynus ATCC 38327]|eukprot:KNE61426.1 hypothetical protein AMAG_18621 [Allomyces macrogynus ATCC 38327]
MQLRRNIFACSRANGASTRRHDAFHIKRAPPGETTTTNPHAHPRELQRGGPAKCTRLCLAPRIKDGIGTSQQRVNLVFALKCCSHLPSRHPPTGLSTRSYCFLDKYYNPTDCRSSPPDRHNLHEPSPARAPLHR